MSEILDPIKLRDARKLSEPEYFVKYGEHPKIILQQEKDQNGDCMGCQ